MLDIKCIYSRAQTSSMWFEVGLSRLTIVIADSTSFYWISNAAGQSKSKVRHSNWCEYMYFVCKCAKACSGPILLSTNHPPKTR